MGKAAVLIEAASSRRSGCFLEFVDWVCSDRCRHSFDMIIC